MNLKTMIKSILYGISLAMAVSILILSYFMDFSCTVNIRFLVIYIVIAIICLTLVGILTINKN